MPLEKAMLIRLDEGQEVPTAEDINGYRADESGSGDNWLRVQFNPETLKTSMSTNLKGGSSGSGTTTGQYIEKSDSSLTLDLVFDTSVEAPDIQQEEGGGDTRLLYQDVRNTTHKLATFFLQSPDQADNQGGGQRVGQSGGRNARQRLRAPARCHFRWGSFGFTGMVASMSETLEYFSSDGVPLRSTVSLSLKQDRFQFQVFEVAERQQNAASALEAAAESNGGGTGAANGTGSNSAADSSTQGRPASGTASGSGETRSSPLGMMDLNNSNHTAGARPTQAPTIPNDL